MEVSHETVQIDSNASADEAAKVAPLPASDTETPTTSLPTSASRHHINSFAGDACGAVQYHADAIPDPVPVPKEK